MKINLGISELRSNHTGRLEYGISNSGGHCFGHIYTLEDGTFKARSGAKQSRPKDNLDDAILWLIKNTTDRVTFLEIYQAEQ